MKKSQLKPWLNEDGSVKSDAEIRKAGQQWPPSVWQKYLATLEVERRKEDSVLPPYEMDMFSAEERISLVFSMAEEESYPLFKVVLNACIRELTPRQRNVIIGRYWKGKTITEIAASTGVSKQAVSKTMQKAMKNLKANLTDISFQRRVIFVHKMTTLREGQKFMEVDGSRLG